MHKELEVMDAKVKVSVLCPAWVNTRIFESGRNRPCEEPSFDKYNKVATQHRDLITKCVQSGLSPEYIAQLVMDAVVEERFYILSHPEWNSLIKTRMHDILEERNPTIEMPPQN
jgi:short-subunit dehydrogenase